jgi:flagellar hook-associated protein 2
MSGIISSPVTNRISGLASGLDTEAIVADLMKASKLKINEVEQKKQILEWKQEFYKEIASALYNFQSKYFSGTSSLLGDALTGMTATSSSPFVSVTSSASSSAQNIYIDDIISLATKTQVTSSARVSSDPAITVNTENLGVLSGKSIVVNLDGVEKTLVFSDIEYTSADDVRAELESLLDSAFGSGRVTVSIDGDTLTLSADKSTLIIKPPTGEGTEGTDPSEVLSFDSYASNRVDMNVSVGLSGLASGIGESGEFTINGKTFTYSSSDTLATIITKINNSEAGVKITYSQLTDKFTMTSNESGSASDITFSDTSGGLLGALFGSGVKTNGTDAVVRLSVNGSTNPDDFITITRSTNTFNVDGVNITLNGMAEDSAQEKISITVSRDVDSLMEKIKTFVSDYNKLLSMITTKLTEEYDADYKPLTEDQKSQMSEKEIELWTQKAKTGLLRNDIYLNNIATQLRSIFYMPVASLISDESPVGSLSDIGISTTKFSDRGQLTINEKKLREELTANPDKVIRLFTQKSTVAYSLYAPAEQQQKRYNESGVLERLSDALNTNLNKVGKKGALISLVGSPTDSFTGETEYSKRIKALKDKIADMNDKLVREEDRYWRQFTAMEKALARLYEQSNWIASMMGNNNR